MNNNDNFYQEQQATAESKKKGVRMFKGKAISDFIVFTLILSYVYLWHAIGIVYSIDLLIGYTLATLVSYVVIYKGTSHLFEKNKNSNKTKRKFLLDKEEVDKELSIIILSTLGYLYFLSFGSDDAANSYKSYHNLSNYFLLSLIAGTELFIYSLLSFFFKFGRGTNRKILPVRNETKEDPFHYNGYLNSKEGIVKDNKPIELIKPIVFLMQVSKAILFAVFIYSLLKIFNVKGADQIGTIFAGTGGSLAALAFLLKENLKSIAAGIRIWTDDLVNVGDRLKSTSLNINGKVKEITLTNIKIQNKDNTFSNIPLEKIFSSNLINKSSVDVHGRRIKITLNIDINSIYTLPDDLKKWGEIQEIGVIKSHIKKKEEEIDKCIKKNNANNIKKNNANNRNQTNIGVFKVYIEKFLKNHPYINNDKIITAHSKSPGVDGVPILIIAYTDPNKVHSYEGFSKIESDIIDHLIKVLNTFKLEPFQYKYKLNNKKGAQI